MEIVQRVRLDRPGWVFAILSTMILAGGPAQARVAPSYIVVDADSGEVLASQRASARRFPASLTKLMTLYSTFAALRERRITRAQRVIVSAHAASMEPTKLGLRRGERITVEQCILAMVTRSANDAAVVISEVLGRTESRFAVLMTARARALGMRDTVFRNASGLPNPAQVTTASDMAILVRHLLDDFPDEYRYFGIRSFDFRGTTIYGHDPMLGTYPGADGLKTGYTQAAGASTWQPRLCAAASA
jgi:D-alanyl-D-alanine carboxypeptidase